MRKKAATWLVGIALVLGGIGFLVRSGSLQDYLSRVTPAPTQAQETRSQGVSVEAEKVKIGEVIEDIRAVGSLQPNESVAIAPEIAGRIASIPFGEGVRVNEGDILVELDPVILKAELDKARSDLTLASANRQRPRAPATRRTPPIAPLRSHSLLPRPASRRPRCDLRSRASWDCGL
jgi:membrane fusion protein (multidrug efflux system)